jgi:hypothetical protein
MEIAIEPSGELEQLRARLRKMSVSSGRSPWYFGLRSLGPRSI